MMLLLRLLLRLLLLLTGGTRLDDVVPYLRH